MPLTVIESDHSSKISHLVAIIGIHDSLDSGADTECSKRRNPRPDSDSKKIHKNVPRILSILQGVLSYTIIVFFFLILIFTLTLS